MIRKSVYFVILMAGLLIASQAGAATVLTLDEAKRVATDSSELILIDFQLGDCYNCVVMRRDVAKEPLLAFALSTVVHLPVDVLSEDGKALAEKYDLGNTFPLFLLADSSGREIRRWAGYGSPDSFIEMLNKATSDLTTVEAREARLRAKPDCVDAGFLASYYFDLDRYAEAVTTYRLLDSLPCNAIDHSYQIYMGIVEQVWQGDLPFDSAVASIDWFLHQKRRNSVEVGRAVQLLARLARRTGNIHQIEDYLDTGMVATGYKNDATNRALHYDILADYALYVKNDTATALQVKEKDLGDGWDQDPNRFFEYARFCLERHVDLERAEDFARRAIDENSFGAAKAWRLQVLADIVYARGRTDEAIGLMQQAIDNSPANRWYQRRLVEMQSGLRR